MQHSIIHCVYTLLVVIFFTSCNSGKELNVSGDQQVQRDTISNQKKVMLLNDSLPQVEFPISGIAENRKGGAVLIADQTTYWIENLYSWDDKVVSKQIKVWGDLVIRNDNPVFLDTGDIVSQGIPVETEEELKAQANRFWILNMRFELVDE
ncbi:MAG: hypothetical protein IPM74_08130 [Crocinitomicaceae bacterium]|nr:hypothetical protein [Crocinitomicaceae bacterium]MBK8925865.1 hypothetical protein [Crocinitomicaceae bacterium]